MTKNCCQRLLLTIALGCILAAHSSVALADELPRLFLNRHVDAVVLAEAVNHYIELGEEATVEAFKELEKVDYISREVPYNERVGWLCRILFVASEGSPIRQPFFGGLSLPRQTMPLEKWPLYPVAKSGEVYVVLSQGYRLGGQPEPISKYVDHCQQNGTFRTEKIPVPAKMDAISSVSEIRESQRWKDIVWQGESPGSSFFISETWVWEKIMDQADSIPDE